LESNLTFGRPIVKYEFAGSKPVLSQEFSSNPPNLTLPELQKIAGGHVEVQMLGIKKLTGKLWQKSEDH